MTIAAFCSSVEDCLFLCFLCFCFAFLGISPCSTLTKPFSTSYARSPVLNPALMNCFAVVASLVCSLDEGTTKYDVQLPAFDENGGLQRIRHDEPTMFLARNHPASMRFVKKFWDWVRDARDYVRSRLG